MNKKDKPTVKELLILVVLSSILAFMAYPADAKTLEVKDYNDQEASINVNDITHMNKYDDHVVVYTKDGKQIDFEFANDLRAKQAYENMKKEIDQ